MISSLARWLYHIDETEAFFQLPFVSVGLARQYPALLWKRPGIYGVL